MTCTSIGPSARGRPRLRTGSSASGSSASGCSASGRRRTARGGRRSDACTADRDRRRRTAVAAPPAAPTAADRAAGRIALVTIEAMEKPLRIGVLAVQGNFREHADVLRRLGAEPVEVRLPEQLAGLDGLIIPGGESTAITRLMGLYDLDDAVREFDGPIFGTCAGMIVLDRDHLGVGDWRTERNAFGRQVHSFEADLDIGDGDEPLRAVFIRAPWLEDAGPRRRGARRGRRSRRARARGTAPRRGVPSGVDGRHARPRTVPEHRAREEKEAPVSGHSKWSSIKHKKGAADAKRGKLFSKLTRAIIVAARDGGPDPAANLALQNAVEKARAALDAEGQHRPRDREGRGHRLRRRRLRDDRLRGLRPRRRRRDRRGADRQPEPHRRRGAPHLLEERRQSRHAPAPSRGCSSGAASSSCRPTASTRTS